MSAGQPIAGLEVERPAWTLEEALRDVCACPACHGRLIAEGAEALTCQACGMRFPFHSGIPCLEIGHRTAALSEEVAWYGEGRGDEPEAGRPVLGERHYLAHLKARRAIAEALSALGASPAWTILSLATGNGVEIPVIEQVCPRLTGIDLSLTALQQFRSRFPYPVFQGNVRRLPFRDEAFDACIVSGLLHHIVGYDDLAPYLQEFRRVLRMGGAVVVVEPNSLYPVQWVVGPVNRVIQRLKPGWRGLVPHERPISPGFLARRLREVGFANIRSVAATFLHNRLPLRLGRLVDEWEDPFRELPVLRLFGWWTVITARRVAA